MHPARDPVPSRSVARTAAPNPRTTNPALVPVRHDRTPARDRAIVLTRRTSETSPALRHPAKTMTIAHPIGTTRATRIRGEDVDIVGSLAVRSINKEGGVKGEQVLLVLQIIAMACSPNTPSHTHIDVTKHHTYSQH